MGRTSHCWHDISVSLPDENGVQTRIAECACGAELKQRLTPNGGKQSLFRKKGGVFMSRFVRCTAGYGSTHFLEMTDQEFHDKAHDSLLGSPKKTAGRNPLKLPAYDSFFPLDTNRKEVCESAIANLLISLKICLIDMVEQGRTSDKIYHQTHLRAASMGGLDFISDLPNPTKL
jgi:hypothetical protein